MIVDKPLQGLYFIVDEALERDVTLNEEYSTVKIRGVLKRDINKIFSFCDKDHSIKCIFNENYLKQYLAGLPSYVTFDSLESTIMFIPLLI